MRFILRTIAAAAISLIVKETLTRNAQTPVGNKGNSSKTQKAN